MNLVIWHYDRYPTAPGVYLGCFPDLGHHITWVTSGTGPASRVVEERQTRIHRIEIQRPHDCPLPRPLAVLVNRWNKFRAFLEKVRLMNRLAADRPDVLQVRELVTEGLLGLHFARRHGVPFVFQYDYPHFEARLYELDRAGEWRPLRRLSLWLLIRGRTYILRHADYLLPLTEAQGERIQRKLGVPDNKMRSFPVGVSEEILDLASSCIPREVPGLDRSKPIVCYMGNLAPVREPAMLFQIMEEVLRGEPETQLLLIGQLNPTVQELIARYSRPGQVITTGFLRQEDIPGVMKNAQVGVFPLPVEDPYGIFLTSSPLKVVEYMSCGLPVVASRIPDAVALLEASGGGRAVENEAKTFAAAVLDYLRDPERAEADGRKGQSYIRENRVFRVMAQNIEEAYRSLVERGDPERAGSAYRRKGLDVEGTTAH